MSLVSQESNGHEKAGINGHDFGKPALTNGNAGAQHNENGFQHLPKLQQDVLLLHGPGQKYSLHSNGAIPDLRSEREILIQVREPSK